MALKGAGKVPDAPEFSFTKLLLTVQSLEDELIAAKQSAKKAASERDVARSQVNDLKEELTACKAELHKKVSGLQKDLQHWTARARAAESDKEESSNEAAALTSQLQNLISSRDRNQQALKEKQYKLELEIGLKTEECKRMQQQVHSYSAILIALETELAGGREALTEAKALVSENSRLVSRHEEKVQGAIIIEERFVAKIRRQAAAFKPIMARLREKEQAFTQLTEAHEKATKELASSEAEAAALKKTVGLLETDVKEHISAKNILFHSLQRSNAVLAESHNAVEQHGIALDSMRLKLRALHADAFEAAASDAAKVREQSTELAALREEVAQLRRQLPEGSACLATVPILEKHSSKEADHREGKRRQDCCGQQTDVHSKLATTEPTPDTFVEQKRGKHSDGQVAGSDQSSQHHTQMEVTEEHEDTFQSIAEHAEQNGLRTAAATPLEPAGALTAKPSHAFQDSSRCQPNQESLRCPESSPKQAAGLQQVHACRSRPWQHSPGTNLKASATAISADTPDELELDGDDSPPSAQQAQRVQQSPLKAIPDRSATQPTIAKSNQAPPWINAINASKTTASMRPGAHNVSNLGAVSTQPAAQAPPRCLPAAQEWKSNVGYASAQAAAQTIPTSWIAAQNIDMHKTGPMAGRATMDPDVEQENGRKGLSRECSKPSSKKPRTLQPDVESRYAAQESNPTGLDRELIEPIAQEPCTAKPDVESKDAASESEELAMNTNAGLINSSPCDVLALFTSFQDLSDDEGHLNENQADVSISLGHLASGQNPKRART